MFSLFSEFPSIRKCCQTLLKEQFVILSYGEELNTNILKIKSLVAEDGYNKHRSLAPGDYSYIDLEDILEEDDEGLGEQLSEGPGKLSVSPFVMYVISCFYFILPTELVYFYTAD
jgi:hypothetical protein